MGKKVYFLDSVEQSDGSYDNTYGVDDVNAIVSNLVGAGVAPFPSGDTYDVSELNSLTSALVAEGTSLDGLKVSFADNKIHIAQGIGYFENGATIVVDSDGEELDYNVAETLYVYAQYNQALNTCGFYTSESEPSSSTGIYVLILATIAADGTVTDKRVIAQSKIATLGKNVMEKHVIVDHSGTENTSSWGNSYDDVVIWERALNINQFNLIIANGDLVYGATSASYRIDNVIIKLEEGVPLDESIHLYEYSWNNIYALRIRYKDGKLQLYVPASTIRESDGWTIGRSITLHNLTLELY